MATAGTDDRRGLFGALIDDGRPLVKLSAVLLILSGLFAFFLAATGHFLPHDVAYVGMTAEDLCAIAECRIVHFMMHDRVAFGGALVAVGVLYFWLAEFPLRARQAWAWWTLLVSGLIGFGSFLAYVGYGYLDSWHGIATLALLPVFVGGMARTAFLLRPLPSMRVLFTSRQTFSLKSGFGAGRVLLLITAACLVLGGLIIGTVGVTAVFVPEDLEYIGLTAAELAEISPRLVPLIAHDRAGFGGGVCCCGATMFLCLWCGTPCRSLWQTVLIVGTVGFGSAIGMHFPIGYTSIVHLAPAYFGTAMFTAGIVLTHRGMTRGFPEPTSMTDPNAWQSNRRRR
jgi:hypothetical protein